MKKLVCLTAWALLLSAQTSAPLDFLNRNHSVLDAHNCYPYDGKWTDRIDRALQGGFPVGIEQDIAWAADPVTGKGRPVVTHMPKTTGGEPTLRDHFFERVRPIVEKALAENDRAHWPLIVLHFDFKSLDPTLLRAVWDLRSVPTRGVRSQAAAGPDRGRRHSGTSLLPGPAQGRTFAGVRLGADRQDRRQLAGRASALGGDASAGPVTQGQAQQLPALVE
jgi:hypothetical protein